MAPSGRKNHRLLVETSACDGAQVTNEDGFHHRASRSLGAYGRRKVERLRFAFTVRANSGEGRDVVASRRCNLKLLTIPGRRAAGIFRGHISSQHLLTLSFADL